MTISTSLSELNKKVAAAFHYSLLAPIGIYFVAPNANFGPAWAAISVICACLFICHHLGVIPFQKAAPILGLLAVVRPLDTARVNGTGILSYLIGGQHFAFATVMLMGGPYWAAVQGALQVVVILYLAYTGPTDVVMSVLQPAKVSVMAIFNLVGLGTVLYAYHRESHRSLARIEDSLENERRMHEKQKDFLRLVCHEIRTPMTGILSVAEMACDRTGLPQSTAEDLEVIFRSSASLLELLNNALDLAKLSARHLVIQRQPTCVHTLTTDIVQMFQSSARQKGLELYCEFSQMSFRPGPSALLHELDPLRVRQALSNLVQNAIKYTHQGRVVVHVSELPGQKELEFTVADTGVGISPDNIHRVFEPFQQTDEGVAAGSGSSGLGLAVVSELCATMGGKVTVTSAVASGSQFTMTIPARRAQGAHGRAFHDQMAFESPTHSPDIRRRLRSSEGEQRTAVLDEPHILLAEDNPVARMVTERQCKKLGVRVTSCEHGGLALEEFEAGLDNYSLCLFDIHMPVMGGVELLRAIRKLDSQLGRPPRTVLAFTASTLEGEEREWLEAGFDGVLGKPCTLTNLRKMLKDHGVIPK